MDRDRDVLLVPTGDELGRRADLVISQRLGLPRAAVHAAIKNGDLTIGGTTFRPSRRLEAEDRIAGRVSVEVAGPPEPEDSPVDIRYEDDHLLVVSKHAGVVTHPGAGNRSGTLVNALLGLGIPLSGIDPERPGIVHRLDKDTSGLMIVAKDDETHRALAAALKRREIARTYLALVRGAMDAPSGTIEAPVGRHPVARRKMAVTPEGRDAVTHYEVIAAGQRCSLLKVTLETGRTHQIRVHLSHLHHPVLGDPLYGGRSELSQRLGVQRPFLHAYRLVFRHPVGGKEISVVAELPGDLQAVLDEAGIGFIHNPDL